MPTLDWIGKQAVVNHDKDVPFRLLKKDPELSVGDSQNLIIKGDNLEALKALMPYYMSKVRLAYIDPPYNTGSQKWMYNDAVNSPEIHKWLQTWVGGEEDLSRHDKWMCMMYPRLKLLHQLLRQDGIVACHIDEHEVEYIMHLFNTIFDESNLLGVVVWDKRNPKGDSKTIATKHEYIVFYAVNRKLVEEEKLFMVQKGNAAAILRKARSILRKVGREDIPDFFKNALKQFDYSAKQIDALKIEYDLGTANKDFQLWLARQDFSEGEKAYKYLDEDGEVYRLVSMAWPSKDKAPEDYYYDVKHPQTGKACPVPAKGWRYRPEVFTEYLENNMIVFGKDHTTQPQRKYLLSENLKEKFSSIIHFGGSATNLLKKIGVEFDYAKPIEVAMKIVDACTQPDDIVLDSFAGSGTTGHAVLELNKQDKGSRKFIMVEMEADIAEMKTAQRIQWALGEEGGCKGGFQFMRLDTTLFDADGNISDPVTYLDLARYVFFTETQRDLEERKVKKPYVGICDDTAYFLFFTERGKNTFGREQLKKLPKNAEKKVVYADRCLLSEETLSRHNVTFKHIPYQVKLY